MRDDDRAFGNVFLLSVFVLLVADGFWLASLIDQGRKADECIAQGRRNCAPLEVPAARP